MSKGFSNWLKVISWGTRQISRIASLRFLWMDTPKTSASPDEALTRDDRMPIRVDLPAPLGASKAKKSPGWTVREMPLRASTPFPYVLRSCFTCRAGVVMGCAGMTSRLLYRALPGYLGSLASTEIFHDRTIPVAPRRQLHAGALGAAPVLRAGGWPGPGLRARPVPPGAFPLRRRQGDQAQLLGGYRG